MPDDSGTSSESPSAALLHPQRRDVNINPFIIGNQSNALSLEEKMINSNQFATVYKKDKSNDSR